MTTAMKAAPKLRIELRSDYITCRAQLPPSQRTAMHRTHCNTVVALPYDGGVVVCPTCHNVVT